MNPEKNTKHKIKKRALISLSNSIVSVFIILLIITTLLIVIIRSIAWTSEATYTSINSMNYVAQAVLREISSNITPVKTQTELTAKLIQNGVITTNVDELVTYTYNLVKSTKLVRGAYWADEQGHFVYTSKEPDGTISSDITNKFSIPHTRIIIHRDLSGAITHITNSNDFTFDPRIRPWYVEAKQKKTSIWTPIYKFYPRNNLGITAATPVLNKDGSVLGVFGADISLEYLTEFVTGQKVTPNGYSFIVTLNEDLVAYPFVPPFTSLKPVASELQNIHSVSLALIDQSLDQFKKSHANIITTHYQGQKWLVTYRVIPELAEEGWLVGVVTPTSDFTAFLWKLNLTTLILMIILLALSAIIISALVTRIIKPVNYLMDEIDKIRNFELNSPVRTQSRIKEIVDLRDAIKGMQRGLKQFQAYVPKTLVKQLIDSGESLRLGGDRKNLVIFFSDIKGFTSISENTAPDELMKQMCDYFEALSHIIIHEKGTIDKYIGDAIMAFWGAPLEVNEPCLLAAKAALQCQKILVEMNERWQAAGKPMLITRIGIHIGDVIVGNVGSLERLNYTVIGDTVNIASRIEGVNKIYKTNILVSEAFYLAVKDKFHFRFVGSVLLRGKKHEMNIYELLDE